MSALCASGIDNITIEVSGSEIPIMDGSAITFIHLIKSAGIVDQQAPKEVVFELRKAIEARPEGKFEYSEIESLCPDRTIIFRVPWMDDNNEVSCKI